MMRIELNDFQQTWGVNEGSEATGMWEPDHSKIGGAVRMGENKWGVLGGWYHCDVRKIVPCQPRAQPLPHQNGQGNEV